MTFFDRNQLVEIYSMYVCIACIHVHVESRETTIGTGACLNVSLDFELQA